MVLPKAPEQNHEYLVVLVCHSAARFDSEGQLTVNMHTKYGMSNFIFRTEYVGQGLQSHVPHDMLIQFRGPAPSVFDAMAAAGSQAAVIVQFLAVSANAAIEDPIPVLGFDCTLGLSDRDFAQAWREDASRLLPWPSRPLHLEATTALMNRHIALISSDLSYADRVHRAMNHYNLALVNWFPGRETLAMEHIYMGIEALTPIVLKNLLGQYGVENQLALAGSLGIDNVVTDKRKMRDIVYELESRIRLDHIFAGDDECYRKIRRASNGLEHGFLAIDEVNQLAREVRDQAAGYLRSAILKHIDLDETTFKTLAEKPYNSAFGCWSLLPTLVGRLSNTDDSLGGEGKPYPHVNWEPLLEHFEKNPTGGHFAKFGFRITPSLPTSVVFHPQGVFMFKPHPEAIIKVETDAEEPLTHEQGEK